MTRFRDIRLLPVVLVAVGALALLKVSGLVINGGYVFGEKRFAESPRGGEKLSWAQDMLGFPAGGPPHSGLADVTGSVATSKKDDTKLATRPAEEPAPIDGTMVVPDPNKPVSASERAILERLQVRRQELEARARELEIRENLLKAAEKRIDVKTEELKATEQRIGAAFQKKDEAEAARFKGLVTMYESMKPKDAAKIFDRLDMKILYEMASQINPRKMSDILAQMTTESAERLTIEIANRAGADKSASLSDLPKIEGRPDLAPAAGQQRTSN